MAGVKCEVVSGMLLETTTQWQSVAYPNGFNVNNTFIAGISITASESSRYTGEYINGNRIIETYLSAAGINIKTTHPDTYGKPFKILLMRKIS